MKTKFITIKKDFFSDLMQINLSKCFDIKAEYVVLKTCFERNKNDLIISIELMGWSNDKQDYLPVDNSVYATEFHEYSIFDYGEFCIKYTDVAKKLLGYFSNFQNYWEFKEFFYHFENPIIVYHYKILKTFTTQELQKLTSIFDYSYPILNVAALDTCDRHTHYNMLFLTHYFNGCFFGIGKATDKYIEISVDLHESDYAVIENEDGKISKEKLFEIISAV